MESTTYLDRIKLPSSRLNALEAKAENSIKRHKVRGFINAGSGSSAVSLLENDENSQLAEHLMHLKTSCSGVKVEIKHRELEQFRYKDETSFITEKVKAIQSQRFKLQNQIQKIQTVVEEVKSKQMNAMLTSKSYEHILDRMKKDEIRYQIKKNDLQKELRGLQKGCKQMRNKNYQLKQFGFLSSSGLKEAQSEIEELKNFRKTTLMNMSRVVDQREILERKKQERKDKSDMIKEMAAGDLQDAELIQLKKFLTVQLFLRNLLKGKIQKLKEFYEPYEIAFLKIKGNTSVKDASSLKSQYYNFENSYNEKAAWVKHLEEEISSTEETKIKLEKQLSDYKLQEMEILSMLEQDDNAQSATFRKDIQDRATNSEIMMMSVREWLKQQAKKIGIDCSNKSEGRILQEICTALKKVKGQTGAFSSDKN